MSIQNETYWSNRPITDEQRDWLYGESNWIEDYKKSKVHPHRQVIIDELKKFEWNSLFEVGCNTGPNLELIKNNFSKSKLYGIDPNPDAVVAAYDLGLNVIPGIAQQIPKLDKSIDVVLADASLMYVPPDQINKAMNQIDRVCKEAVIIVERFSEQESNNGHIWSRNYKKLLEDRGFKVEMIKITEELWPGSPNWAKYGYYFIGKR